jgi:hypothetical protein
MPLGSLPSDWSSCGVHDVKGKGEMVSVCLTIHVFLCECCGQKGCKELRALGRDGGGLKQIRAFPGLCSHVEETLCSATSGGTPTENHLHTPKIKAIRFFFFTGPCSHVRQNMYEGMHAFFGAAAMRGINGNNKHRRVVCCVCSVCEHMWLLAPSRSYPAMPFMSSIPCMSVCVCVCVCVRVRVRVHERVRMHERLRARVRVCVLIAITCTALHVQHIPFSVCFLFAGDLAAAVRCVGAGPVWVSR